MSWFLELFRYLKVGEAYILVWAHQMLSKLGLDPGSGLTWALAICVLTLVVRMLVLPLFVKQIRSMEAMREMQPKLQELQKRYKGKTDRASREAMAKEQMELYKANGTNPFASCLPIIIQSPFFIALYRVLVTLPKVASGEDRPLGPLTQEVARQADASQLFGVGLSDVFSRTENWSSRIFIIVLTLLMAASQYYTQKMMMAKNTSPEAMNNPFMKQQKMILWLMPLMMAVSGYTMPVGVQIYWFMSNIWGIGQQLYILRYMPTPGSEAHKALLERRAARGRGPVESPEAELVSTAPRGQRVQPVGKARQKKTGKPGATLGTSGAALDDDNTDGANDGVSRSAEASPGKVTATNTSTSEKASVSKASTSANLTKKNRRKRR